MELQAIERRMSCFFTNFVRLFEKTKVYIWNEGFKIWRNFCRFRAAD